MPKHIITLLLLLIAFLVFAYAGIVYLTDPSFYRFGHYRSDSVPELAAGIPKFRGPEYCQLCHVDRHAEWSSGSHKTVKCEVCHGAAGEHPDTGKLPIPDDPVKLCTTCHEAMPARPARQPQIVVGEHPAPHEGQLVCISCHNPHSPRMGDASVNDLLQSATEAAEVGEPPSATDPAEASGAPALSARCKGCHGAQGEGKGKFPGIAGSDIAEFARQMNEYKSGARQSKMMNKIAQSLSDEEIRVLASYYANLATEAQ